MRTLRVYHVDAFSHEPFGGNPAGVVPDAGGLSDALMQQIARELNLSETAFLLPPESGGTDYRIRYFTPTTEVDFCGHATVGASWVLATEGGWADKAERVVLMTNKGPVPVEWVRSDGRPDGPLAQVRMTQVAPQVREVGLDAAEVARLAGVAPGDLDDRLPIRLGYTGNWHLLVPVRTRAAIDAAVPPLEELAAVNRQQGAITTHLFTFDAAPGFDLYTRDFAPAVGIPEDPVTGAANGALAGYLLLEGVLDRGATHHLRIGQGDAVGRPGTLFVAVGPAPDGGVTVQVGGAAVVTIAGTMTLPA